MSLITNTRVRRDLLLSDGACLLPDRPASCGLLEGCSHAPTTPLEVGIPAATTTAPWYMLTGSVPTTLGSTSCATTVALCILQQR